MTITLKKYGTLEYVEAEDYYAGDWSVYDVDENVSEEGDTYTVIISGDKTTIACTID